MVDPPECVRKFRQEISGKKNFLLTINGLYKKAKPFKEASPLPDFLTFSHSKPPFPKVLFFQIEKKFLRIQAGSTKLLLFFEN